MEENKLHPTSIRLSAERIAKLDRVAEARNVSRSGLVGMMIDGIEEVVVPPVRVKLPDVRQGKVPA